LDEAAADVDQLTPRETEILSMIARGASNQEIADQLFLSVGTVKGHVNHIFSKLDVHNRTAAVARARSSRLIEL
jgi:DNA-binding NarL/FixJ family response regulator